VKFFVEVCIFFIYSYVQVFIPKTGQTHKNEQGNENTSSNRLGSEEANVTRFSLNGPSILITTTQTLQTMLSSCKVTIRFISKLKHMTNG
jgi:hypothetical protein